MAPISRNFLKVDLHTHSADDPEEQIQHTSCELIDKACHLGFDAISITNHNAISFTRYLQDYARERGIVLISGAEIDICGKHVLVLNAHDAILKARTFEDLRRLRTPENLIVAPHPYFPGFASLLWHMRKNMDVFDAIEFSWFYHSHINFNRFAIQAAARHGLPLICTSDCHHLTTFGSAYSLVDSEKDREAIIAAVRSGRLEIAANPLKLKEFGKHGIEHITEVTTGALRKLLLSGEGR